MKINPIQKFILKDKHNLRIAATVGDAWPEVRAQMVAGFLDRLEARLKKKLKGFQYERDGRFGIDAYPSFYFWKPAWEGQYGLCLQFGDYGELVVMGVYREIKRIGKRLFSEELLDAIVRHHPSARTLHPWWEARVTMQSPATDWRKSEVLWRIKTDDTFLQEVSELLLEMAKLSEPIVDGLARKK